MKIGTDGVLLGAWAPLQHHPKSILDIGTGTGLLALMMAQRNANATIDAVEIDSDAYCECVENFENSKWNDRLFCYHGDFTEFAKTIEISYDLIICNPPFFNNPSKNIARSRARSEVTLSLNKLIDGVAKLLSADGVFCVVIPTEKVETLKEIALKKELYLNQQLSVKGHANAKIKRAFMAYSFTKKKVQKTQITLEIERHQFTEDYRRLTKDFYLKL